MHVRGTQRRAFLKKTITRKTYLLKKELVEEAFHIKRHGPQLMAFRYIRLLFTYQILYDKRLG
jgi:hypothetical protein